MSRYWLYVGGEEPDGPYTPEEITNVDDWVDGYYCKVGDEEWKRPEEFEELNEKLQELKPSGPPGGSAPDVPDEIRDDVDGSTTSPATSQGSSTSSEPTEQSVQPDVGEDEPVGDQDKPEPEPDLDSSSGQDEDEIRTTKRNVTVLFADISGYTELTESMGDDRVREITNELFDLLQPIVQNHGGEVDKYIGDEVMVLFGGKKTDPEAPRKAVSAGMKMIDKAKRFSQKRNLDLGLHVGINTGKVVAGHVGSRQEQEYSVMGRDVNVASRLTDRAETGEVIVGQSTYDRVRSRFEGKPMEELDLKGISGLIDAYQITGYSQGEVQDQDNEIHAPFVSRRQEKNQLLAMLNGESEEVCGLVTGEGGVGKSRLIAEVLDQYDSKSSRVTNVQGDPYSDHNPYSSLLNLFDKALGISEQERPAGPKDIEEAYDLRGTTGEDLSVVYGVSENPGGEITSQSDDENDPSAESSRSERLADFLYESFQGQTHILFVDDVQWIEPSTIELLKHLVQRQRFGDRRVYILMTSRPEGISDEVGEEERLRMPGEQLDYEEEGALLEGILNQDDSVLRIDLGPLQQEEVRDLVEKTFPGTNPDARLIKRLKEKTGGVALHLEHALWSLVDLGAIEEVETDQWQITEWEEVPIPSTARDLIVSRVDRLDDVERDTLMAASVLGSSFERWLIVDVLEDYSEEQVDSALYQLLVKRFLRAQEGKFIFHHTTIQDVTYELMVQREKERMHSRAADLIRDEEGDEDPVVQDLLVRHYRGAGRWEEVIRLRMERIEQALRFDAPKEAKGFIEEIEDVGWPEGLGDEYRGRFLRARGVLALKEFNDEAAREDLQKSSDMLQELDDSEYAECLYWEGCLEQRLGELEEAEENFRQSLEIYEAEGEDAGRARCYRSLGSLAERQGRTEMANRYYKRSLEINEMRDARLDQAFDLFHLAKFNEIKQQDLEQAKQYYNRSIDILSDLESKRLEAVNCTSLGRIARKRRKYDRAERLLKKSLNIYEEIGDEASRAFNYSALAQLFLQQNDVDAAYEYYDEAFDLNQKLENTKGMAFVLNGMARCARLQGEFELATEHAERAIKLSREINDTNTEAFALGIKGKIHRDSEQFDEAAECFRQAAQMHRDIGRDRSRSYVLTKLGEVKEATGDLEQARENYKRALEINELTEYNPGIVNNLRQLGDIERQLDNPEQAREYYKRSIDLRQQEKFEEDPEQEIDLYSRYGELCLDEGKLEEARTTYKTLIDLYQQMENPSGRVEAMGKLGEVRQLQGDLEEAEELFESALSIAEPLEEQEMIFYLTRRLAKLNEGRRGFDRAESLFQECLSIAERLEDPKKLATSYSDLGLLAQKRNQYQQAREMYEHSIRLDEKHDHVRGQAIGLRKLAKLHSKQNNWESAQEAYDEALQISRSISDRQGEAISLEGLAEVSKKRHNIERAKNYYEEALDINTELNNDQNQAISLSKLAKLHLECGELEKADSYFRRALEIQGMINFDFGKSISLGGLGVVYRLQGEHKQASEYLIDAVELAQDLNSPKNRLENLYQLARNEEQRRNDQEFANYLARASDCLEELDDSRKQCLVNCARARRLAQEQKLDQAREALSSAENYLTEGRQLFPSNGSQEELGTIDEVKRRDLVHAVTEQIVQQQTDQPDSVPNPLEKLLDTVQKLSDRPRFGRKKLEFNQLGQRYFSSFLDQERV